MLGRNSLIFLLVSLVLITQIPQVSALIVSVSPDKPSVNLIHGQSTSVKFSVSHQNDLCTASCDYVFANYDSGNSVDSGTNSISVGGVLTKTYTLTAPSKKLGGISGQNKYIFRVDCQDQQNLICWSSATDSDEVFFTLNYDLSSEEKSAKSYLDNYLNSLKSTLDKAEKDLYNLNSRFSGVASNVLIGDFIATKNDINNNFDSLKNNQERVSIYYDQLEFISAKNSFDVNWNTNANNLVSEIAETSSKLTERIELHNIVGKKISDLSGSLNTLSKSVKALDLTTRFNQIDLSIKDLSNKYSSGNFESYDDLLSSVDINQNGIDKLKQEIDVASSSKKDEIRNALKAANELLCSEKKFCNNAVLSKEVQDLGDFVINFCEFSIADIKKNYDTANKQDYEQYSLELKKVKDENQKINKKNEIIKNLNLVRKNLSDTINSFDLENVYSQCFQNPAGDTSLESYNLMLKECEKNLYEVMQKTQNQKIGFFKKIKLFFTKLFKQGISVKDISSIDILPEPTEPINLDFSSDFKSIVNKYCSIDLKTIPKSEVQVSLADNPEGKNLQTSSISSLTEHKSQCCTLGVCRKCCEGDECKSDIHSYPIIFLHGHSFTEWDSPEYSLDAFNKLIDSLLNSGILIGGTITPQSSYSSVEKGDWGKSGSAVSVKTTYYYGVYNDNGQLVSKPSKSESIETYADRLKDMIELIKYRTNRDKVVIIAHSMGGLVSREYIKKYGDSSVYKLIMVGTPNHGIYGNVKDFCSSFLIFNIGSDVECEQMAYDNNFITTLNSGDETPGNVKYYTIRGSGCALSGIDGDGIVRTTSVPLDGAQNYEIKGKCSGTANRGFHSDLLDPSKYPEVLEKINTILKE